MKAARRAFGFTLIELLAALFVLSLLALMSYRGLGAMLETRTQVRRETAKWQHVAAFFARFQRDVDLAAPRPVRTASGELPAWIGRMPGASRPLLEFSRFASADGEDSPRRIAYGLDGRGQIELWLYPALDRSPDTLPARYPVLEGVRRFEIRYLDRRLAWVDTWPQPHGAVIPRAVRVNLVLASGEQIMRVFALQP